MRKLVCYGDSITVRKEDALFPRLTSGLEKILPDWIIINSGVAGNNTFDALKRIESDVLIHKPDLVTILFGANDAAFHKMVQLEDYEKNLREITKRIGPHKSILISPAPVDEVLQKARTNVVIKAYADAVERVANDTCSHFIDLFKLMINDSNYPSMLTNNRNDGLHFGELGYQFLSELIANKIKLLK